MIQNLSDCNRTKAT